MKNFVIHTPTKKLLEAVLNYLEKTGYKLIRSSHDLHAYGLSHCIDPTDKTHVMYGDDDFFKREGFEIISGEVYLKIAGIDFDGRIQVKLNNEYTATVNHSVKLITVGCKSFPFEAIENLYNAIKEQ